MLFESVKLDDTQLDAIREVGNIGAGHAATALSQLIEKKIFIKVPQVLFLTLEEIITLVGGPQALIAGVTMHVLGDVSAKIVMVLPRSSAVHLATMLTKQQADERQILTAMEHSAIKEVGNILAGAYLNALTEFLGLMLLQSVPQLVFDLAEAVVVEISKGMPEDVKVLCIETTFTEPNRVINGHFFLIPEKNSLEQILKAIRVKS
ncbi:MAG: chemotaxis protein CheC [Candidatus Firestonebacteria bacterium]|nr:chemotaxis protein CheC [Candidatus Firestonebacteria bacterium]